MNPLVTVLLGLGLILGLSACSSAAGPSHTPTPDAQAIQKRILEAAGDVPAHDPTILREGSTYYRFTTGVGIPISCSPDLVTWTHCSRVFLAKPGWLLTAVPGVGDLWAPDVIKMNGKYYLYYSASTFGSNLSVIALATNTTLDPNNPDYKWVDEGEVVKSSFKDNFNAIDPNIVLDAKQQPWLAYGSYWSGIKLRKLDPQTGKPPEGSDEVFSIASRPPDPHAIEAAFILPKDGEYFLFVSFDQCCQGVASTYNIRVGRSKEITGPYLDRDGKKMTEGGGSLVLDSKERWRGPGHSSVLVDEGKYYLVYHAYDAQKGGQPTLRVEEFIWDDQGWPVAPSQLVGK